MKECSLSLSHSFSLYLHHLYSLAPLLFWRAMRLQCTLTHTNTNKHSQFQASLEPVFQLLWWQQRSFFSSSQFQHSISWAVPIYLLSLCFTPMFPLWFNLTLLLNHAAVFHVIWAYLRCKLTLIISLASAISSQSSKIRLSFVIFCQNSQ